MYLFVVYSKDSTHSPFCRQSHQVNKQWISILATCHKSSVYHNPKEKNNKEKNNSYRHSYKDNIPNNLK